MCYLRRIPCGHTLYKNKLFSLKCGGEIIVFTDDSNSFCGYDGYSLKAETNFKIIKQWFSYKILTISIRNKLFNILFNTNRPPGIKLTVKLKMRKTE